MLFPSEVIVPFFLSILLPLQTFILASPNVPQPQRSIDSGQPTRSILPRMSFPPGRGLEQRLQPGRSEEDQHSARQRLGEGREEGSQQGAQNSRYAVAKLITARLKLRHGLQQATVRLNAAQANEGRKNIVAGCMIREHGALTQKQHMEMISEPANAVWEAEEIVRGLEAKIAAKEEEIERAKAALPR